MFVVLKMLYYDKDENIVIEQVSFVLGKNYVLTFQESEGDVFGPIRDRLRYNNGRIRDLKSDYLLYALIDAVVDNYFSIIETLGNKIGNKADKDNNKYLDNPAVLTWELVELSDEIFHTDFSPLLMQLIDNCRVIMG